MKFDRKGFMLAEVVVVAVVIATVLVTLFTGLNNVSSAYETRNRYYDVDSLYIAMEYNDIIKRNVVSLDAKVNEAMVLYNWASNQSGISETNIQLFDDFYFYDIGDNINAYITPYDNEMMLSLKNINNTKETFKEYMDYLSGNLNFNDAYNYMIIVERCENNNIDDCYYYALKLKY